MNGDMSESYVKGSSVHKAFNRAINIHNSHNILLQNNVIYDVKGGALFLEDGIETGILCHEYEIYRFCVPCFFLLIYFYLQETLLIATLCYLLKVVAVY